MLPSFLPSIRKLYRVEDPLTTLSPYFTGIRKVKMLATHGGNLALLNLPFEKLESLDVNLIHRRDDRDWTLGNFLLPDIALTRRCSTITELTVVSDWEELLGHRVSTRDCVPSLLEALHESPIERLRFSIGSWPGRKTLEGRIRLDVALLIDGLQSLRESLENLTVDLTSYACRALTMEFLGLMRPFVSVKQFNGLKRLEIPQQAILHHNYGSEGFKGFNYSLVLPASLEHITIFCPDERILCWLKCLLPHLKEFPYLRGIGLSCMRRGGKRAKWFLKHHVTLDIVRTRLEVAITQSTVDLKSPYGNTIKEEEADQGTCMWTSTWSDDNWSVLLFGDS
jgi:hypothetical protein